MSPCRWNSPGCRDAMARARRALDAVGLAHRLTHLPGQLSGGEQQRVALARAFAPRPRLLLADEPTGNLDQATGDAVMDLLFRLRAETGTTLMLITHDPHLAARCSRRIHLADGRVVADRPVARACREGGLMLAFRLARRELRGGVRGLWIVLLCLALGVAVIAAVGTLRAATDRGLAEDGQAHPGRRSGGGERLAAPAGYAARLAARAGSGAVGRGADAVHAGRAVRRAAVGRAEGCGCGLATGGRGYGRG